MSRKHPRDRGGASVSTELGQSRKTAYSMIFNRFESDPVQAGRIYWLDRKQMRKDQKCEVLYIEKKPHVSGGYMIHCLVDGNRESFIMAQAKDCEWKECGGVGKGITIDVRAVQSPSSRPGIFLDGPEGEEEEDMSEMQGRAAS